MMSNEVTADRTGAPLAPQRAAVELFGVRKTFGGQVALRDCDLQINRGEVHTLIGHNGSGKSTLVKVLAGVHQPDAGTAMVDGRSFALGSSRAAHAAGLRFIHQDLGLIESMSVAENVAIGAGFVHRRGGRVSWREERRRAQAAVDRIGFDIDVRQPVGELRAPERTAVAVARALIDWEEHGSCLVLDEPTASLPSHEVGDICRLVRAVSAHGVAVLYISHRLSEILDIGDVVTVLRDGVRVTSEPVAGHTEASLARLMVGNVEDARTRVATPSERQREDRPVLSVHHLAARGLAPVDLEVHAGEVIGIAGLTGSGRDYLLGCIFGRNPRSGQVLVSGREVRAGSIRQAIGAGMAYVPSNRGDAFFGALTAAENVLIGDPWRHWRGVFRRRAQSRDVMASMRQLGVRPEMPGRVGSAFSGGNQQKLLLARWLRLKPRVLLLEEPTQGVDVAAKARIHSAIDDLAAAGGSVIVASAESEELERLCDRVLIVRGAGDASWTPTTGWDAEWLTSATLEMVA